VENAAFLSVVQAVASAARLREIQALADSYTRHFRNRSDGSARPHERRTLLEHITDALGHLELELGYSVETPADLATLIPSLRPTAYHTALYEAMGVTERAAKISRGLSRLANSAAAELTSIQSAEQRSADRRRVRTVAAVTFVTTVTATDLHSGVATGGVMMRVDAGSYRLGSSISVTTPGYHMVYARAVDNAGNSREIAKKIVINNKVSLSAPRISGSATHTRATKFVGTVSPGHSVRVTVTIQRRVSGRWRSYSIDRPTSNSAGAWSFKRKVRAGTFRLRATTSAGVPWLAGASAWRTVKIK
jgi:hypothetical protein